MPSALNGKLRRREIDVAPSSSIEYALNAPNYRLLPDLVIGSRGPVGSILLLSGTSIDRLSGHTVAIPTASATSVVLLKILLHMRALADIEYRWFDQAREDPLDTGATAALYIGDVALRPNLHPEAGHRYDLGEEWFASTGLPFAFALWQASTDDEPALRELHGLLLESREFGRLGRDVLAERYAARFGMSAAGLRRYWAELHFELDEEMLAGLSEFYRLAAAIGEIPAVPALRWV